MGSPSCGHCARDVSHDRRIVRGKWKARSTDRGVHRMATRVGECVERAVEIVRLGSVFRDASGRALVAPETTHFIVCEALGPRCVRHGGHVADVVTGGDHHAGGLVINVAYGWVAIRINPAE